MNYLIRDRRETREKWEIVRQPSGRVVDHVNRLFKRYKNQLKNENIIGIQFDKELMDTKEIKQIISKNKDIIKYMWCGCYCMNIYFIKWM